MKREELLAWIGIVLAIPPIVYMVVGEGKLAAGLFVVLLASALIREYLAAKRKENVPYLRLSTLKSGWISKTGMPKSWNWNRSMRLRVNHPTHEFVAAYLGGDGTADNFKIDGGHPSELRTSGVRTEIVKRFDHELMPGDQRDIVQLYPSQLVSRAKEGIGHIIEFETKTVELEVIFNKDKPCLNGELLKRYGGTVHNAGGCRRTTNGLRLAVEFRNPPLGAEYILQWEW
jgi:hypothetical protein